MKCTFMWRISSGVYISCTRFVSSFSGHPEICVGLSTRVHLSQSFHKGDMYLKMPNTKSMQSNGRYCLPLIYSTLVKCEAKMELNPNCTWVVTYPLSLERAACNLM